MENQLAKYFGKSNLKDAIAEINVVQGVAKDSGNTYYCVELSFINGYRKRMFLKNEEIFCWVNAFEQAETQKQINQTF